MEVKIVTHPQYGEFRIATEEGKIYFVARDVAAALNYARPEGFVSRHVSKANKILVPLRGKNSTNVVKTTVVTEKGLEEMAKATTAVQAQELKEWLVSAASALEPEAELPEVVTIEGVRGYLDAEGTAYLNVEDVARGLGFVQVHAERVTISGELLPPYMAVRWDRVNKYRAEFDLKPVKAGDFIPENEFYLLAMKANNEMAKKFQLEVANKILPSIRKNGYYVSETPPPISVVDLTDLTERVARIEILFDKMIEALESIKNSTEKQMTKEQRGRELVALADKLAPSPEKQKILLHAANLINGKKIF